MEKSLLVCLTLQFTCLLNGSTLPSNYPIIRTACMPHLDFMTSKVAKNSGSRNGTKIDEIVLHDTGSPDGRKYEDALNYIANPGDGRQVSIHYYIGRETMQLVKMVSEAERAFHVAEPGHNARSVGIEMFKRKSDSPEFTQWQYKTVSQLVYDIAARNSVPLSSVVGHGDIQANRADPEGFDWIHFKSLISDIETCVAKFVSDPLVQ